jgi:hypothetical protein
VIYIAMCSLRGALNKGLVIVIADMPLAHQGLARIANLHVGDLAKLDALQSREIHGFCLNRGGPETKSDGRGVETFDDPRLWTSVSPSASHLLASSRLDALFGTALYFAATRRTMCPETPDTAMGFPAL